MAGVACRAVRLSLGDREQETSGLGGLVGHLWRSAWTVFSPSSDHAHHDADSEHHFLPARVIVVMDVDSSTFGQQRTGAFDRVGAGTIRVRGVPVDDRRICDPSQVPDARCDVVDNHIPDIQNR